MKAAKRILVVDDEKTILLSLAYALKADGVDVITCNKAEWAEKALQNYYFDIVITDVRLSRTEDNEGMKILEMTKRKHPNSKVIIMTAFGSDDLQQEAKRLGADLYFDKPIDLDMLIQAIERLGVPMKKSGTGRKPGPAAP